MDGTPSGRIQRCAQFGLALVPFALAVAAHCGAPLPRPVEAAQNRPGLAFSQYLVDLGEVAPSELVFAYFDFKNVGETPVHIDKLEASCGCLQPHLTRKHLRPGERGGFRLDVQTANQPAGPKEYYVKVKYNDPHPREANVVFRVALPAYKVFVTPRALLIHDQGTSAPLEHTIEIVDRRPKPLSVIRADCTRAQLAQVELRESEVDTDGYTHIRLTATIAGNLPDGRYDAVIRIHTEDPDYRYLRVPLRIISERNTQRHDPEVQTVGAVESDQPRVEPAAAVSR